jgi:integrase
MSGYIRPVGSDRWQVMFDVSPDPVTGRRRRRSRTISGTRDDAVAELARIQQELSDGLWIDDGTMRLTDFTELFIDARRRRWRPTTESWYRQKLAYATKVMGHRKLSQITGGSLTVFYGRLLDRGLSPTTVQHVHRALRAMFRAAVKWGYLKTDPSERAEPPTTQRPRMQTWTAGQLALFLEEVSGHRFGIAYLIAAMTGMRRGEVAGLRWTDIADDYTTMTITQTITVVNGRTHVGPPKTGAGIRRIALDETTGRLLRAHRVTQRETWLAMDGNFEDLDHVVAWPDGRPVHPDLISKAFRKLVDTLELPAIRLHDLRHTYATLAMELGVNVVVISERLGHASPAITTNLYTHVRDHMDRDAAEAIADAVRRPREQPEGRLLHGD